MTEVPEHLLRRSKERRAALGLGGDAGEGSDAPAGVPAAAAPALAETSATPPPRGSAADTSTELETGAGAVALMDEPPPMRPRPTRTKTPFWIMPVLVILPVYAFLYFGAFGNRHAAAVTPLSDGNSVFHTAGCSGCHGTNGEGGVGPKLAGGEAVKTFPDAAAQISWVKTGSGPFTGKKYGDPNRAGGQHGPATGGMPAFGASLSEQQIQDVVLYERTGL